MDAQDFLRSTALHATITGVSAPCVEILVADEPDVKRNTFGDGQSVLHAAIRIGNVTVINLSAKTFPDLLSAAYLNGGSPFDSA